MASSDSERSLSNEELESLSTKVTDTTFKFADGNFPWINSNQFGKDADAPSYYYLNDPTPRQLRKIARNSSIGWRIVYEITNDIWNNNFKVRLVSNNKDKEKEINKKLHDHLIDIRFYDEMRRTTAFDREQGESLLFLHRVGEKIEFKRFKEEEKVNPNSHTDFEEIAEPPNLNADVYRVEAINKMDYVIPRIKEFGHPNKYRISFWKEGAGKPYFDVHYRNAVRVKTYNIDYDVYTGQSHLKAIYATLIILLHVERAMGDAAFRWGVGIPAIHTKGIRDANSLNQLKTLIGNPTTQSWMLVPSEIVENIQMLGLSGNAMDLPGFQKSLLELIVVATSIPRVVLMGEAAGAIEGSMVTVREYFSYLDRQHTMLEPFLREYFWLDPFTRKLLDEDFEIDWGLRQVLTKQEEADFQAQLFDNATTATSFATLAEVRDIAKLPPLNTIAEDKVYQNFYGMKVKEFEQLMTGVGTWREAVTREVIETPEEREIKAKEEKEAAQLGTGGGQPQQPQGGGQPQEGGQKSELQKRKEQADKRKEAQVTRKASFAKIRDVNELLDLPQEEKDAIILDAFQTSFKLARKLSSMNKLAKLLGIRKKDLLEGEENTRN